MRHISSYSFPTEIRFGAGAINLAPEIFQQNLCRRPLILTDRALGDFQLIKDLQSKLEHGGLSPSVSAKVFGNPDISQVDAALKDYRDHRSDSVIAVGGGAVLDVAKAVALMSSQDGHLFDYQDGKQTREFKNMLPFAIAVPTTAGTGSEVGRSTVISDPTTHQKKIIFHPSLLPKVVLADPLLTLSLPTHITAATGMDALTHLIESFIAKGSHPMCEGIALEGVSLVAASLVDCVRFSRTQMLDDEKHLSARSNMMHAAMMGAVAFQKGLGVNHSCAHALSTVTDMHHGLANAIMLPYCMRFNYPGNETKFARLSMAAGVGSGRGEFVSWLVQLQIACGMPLSLREAGVSLDALDSLVKAASQDGCHLSNPKPVSSADFSRIFSDAFSDGAL